MVVPCVRDLGNGASSPLLPPTYEEKDLQRDSERLDQEWAGPGPKPGLAEFPVLLFSQVGEHTASILWDVLCNGGKKICIQGIRRKHTGLSSTSYLSLVHCYDSGWWGDLEQVSQPPLSPPVAIKAE